MKKDIVYGVLLSIIISIPSWYLGKSFPIIGAPVIGMLSGIIVGIILKDKKKFEPGIKFTSKKILQYAVIMLGFGLNLSVVMQTGRQSLPIIISTILTSLIVAYVIHKLFNVPSKIATLVGVGSSICGGSAIAATAPVIEAGDEEVAQAISVVFLFNVLAAIIFPTLGGIIGLDTTSGEAFGIFAGTAVNDTSSVTATATTWDNIYNLGTQTLDKAVMVKLTRTLAIIPITLFLAMYRAKKENRGEHFSLKKSFPNFILYFILASLITTVSSNMGVSAEIFSPFKMLSKFLIVMAMSAIGINTDIIKLIKTGKKPIIIGACCWCAITIVTLSMQKIMGIW